MHYHELCFVTKQADITVTETTNQTRMVEWGRCLTIGGLKDRDTSQMDFQIGSS